ncbi:carbohydrate ABC transporter permease [Paenibacillus spongiae]|uniref:Carbohydrate ABC transporter permease n=1 Tax=Paenibacillus spongiae TaxID=2909671 RepID=A0ABY5S1C0_9BACL|nr:carbohydrate ABC transporter permease [Paenibacillus spongiae]UVI27350.1 carbohydrate ABC transporter permease [Paenibacillus spongiae]
MRYKESILSRLFDVANYTFIVVMMIVMIYPLINVLSISLSTPSAIVAGKVGWLPKGFNLEGYKYLFEDGEIFRAYRNTILYAGVGTFITLALTSLAAYTLAIREFVLRKFATVYWAVTMFIGGGLIPTFLVIKNLGMMNTFWVMVIPGAIGAFTVFVFRTFFQELPVELRESAYMDGANDFVIWYKVTLPLSKALLATFALFTIVGHWNSWFNALLYLKDSDLHPLQMYLRRIVVEENLGSGYTDGEIQALLASNRMNPKNLQMAAVMVAMAPILFIYPFIQRYFVKGVMIGSIKG